MTSAIPIVPSHRVSTGGPSAPGLLKIYDAFVPDPQGMFWAVLDEFYGLNPVELNTPATRRLVAGGDRAPGRMQFNDIRETLEGRGKGRPNHMPPHVAILAGMLGRELPDFALPDSATVALYRNGDDFIDLHADSPMTLGPDPDNVRIAIVSLGASRALSLQRITGNPWGADDEEPPSRRVLPSGSLLTMEGSFQQAYTHAIERCDQEAPRLSVSFTWRPWDCDADEVPVALVDADDESVGLARPWFVGPASEALVRFARLGANERESHSFSHPKLSGFGWKASALEIVRNAGADKDGGVAQYGALTGRDMDVIARAGTLELDALLEARAEVDAERSRGQAQ